MRAAASLLCSQKQECVGYLYAMGSKGGGTGGAKGTIAPPILIY